MDATSAVLPCGEPLFPGERLLWSGAPGRAGGGQPRRLVSRLVGVATGGVGLGAVAVVATQPDASTAAVLVWLVVALPLLLVGLYLVAGADYHGAWLRARTHYALTSERVLLGFTERPTVCTSCTSLALVGLAGASLVLRRDGSGTIALGLPPGPGQPDVRPALDTIPDARAVYALLLAAQRDAELEARRTAAAT